MSNYADITYYQNTYKGTKIPEKQIEEKLKEASQHIDTLTYNRIVGRKFENLTKFQQEIIEEVVCRLADFEYENFQVIQSMECQWDLIKVGMLKFKTVLLYQRKIIVY